MLVGSAAITLIIAATNPLIWADNRADGIISLFGFILAITIMFYSTMLFALWPIIFAGFFRISNDILRTGILLFGFSLHFFIVVAIPMLSENAFGSDVLGFILPLVAGAWIGIGITGLLIHLLKRSVPALNTQK
ncbi:MAG: hypothetical protein ACI8YI_001681 [Paracoccaceae bacterium]|jgi:hypothetical protein